MFFENSTSDANNQALVEQRGKIVEAIKQIQFLESIKYKGDGQQEVPFQKVNLKVVKEQFKKLYDELSVKEKIIIKKFEINPESFMIDMFDRFRTILENKHFQENKDLQKQKGLVLE